MNGPADPRWRPLRTREVFLIVAVCLYAPFSWLILLVHSWDSYHRTWLKLWPVLPGFVPGALWLHGNDAVEFTVWGLTTAVLLIGLTAMGTRGVWGLVAAVVTALAISIPSAWLAYGLFLA